MRLLQGDCLEQLKDLPDNSVDSIVTDPPYGLSFMGAKWDYDVPSVDVWKECLRVLKPGGHLLSFGGSRTYHRMVVNVEDAGFEVRDQLLWIYGSGFPKSHNIGKKSPEHIGWGTALKPAHEPILLARKPLSEKTIVDNVLKWGTGGINIDESRISYRDLDDRKSVDRSDRKVSMGWRTDDYVNGVGEHTLPPEQAKGNDEGRFPANIILSEEAAENLDQHSPKGKGQKTPRKQKSTRRYGENNFTSGGFKTREGYETPTYNDEGGASRYFYVVKPSKKEKEFGMMGEDKVLNRVNSGGIENDPKWAPTVRKNNHPTVKPIKLMEYLIKMVTPVGGTTLDPFMGSGTTGIAAQTNGFNFIGIEMSEEYMDIAQQRIDAWTKDHQTKLDI